MSIFEQLAAPFPHGAIHWRAQSIYERDGKFSALALAYIDARDVMDRLDAVCGPEGWQDYFDETPRGRVICRLSVEHDGIWIAKSDAAGDTAVEGEKGGVSDAFKRAAVKWGIGRYLYRLGNTYAPCEVATDRDGKPKKTQQGNFIFKKWLPEAQSIFVDRLNGVVPEPNRDANRRKLAGPHTSITALEKAIKAFSGELAKVADWEQWLDLRGKNEALLEQAERDHPDWWFGWKGQPDGFVPLRDRIDNLEAGLAKQKAAFATA